MSNYKELTIEEIKEIPSLLELKKHIHDTTSGLIGCQWVVAELFVFPDRNSAKIIGTDKENKPVSAPIDSWRERQYCGIHYHFEEWTKNPETIKGAQQLQESHNSQFCFYNPYQDRIKLIPRV